MLERYLLSTLASKFGHVFEDFDENTTAELSAWRGVLELRNLHLRKDALKHLGVPLAGGVDVDDDDVEDEEYDDVEEGDDVGDDDEPTNIDDSPGSGSDDDSFRSCASQIDEEDDISQTSLPDQFNASNPTEDAPPANNISTKSQKSGNNNIPTIEISHGSIGSLELHIPWRLLRATKKAAAAAQKEQSNTQSPESGEEMKVNSDIEDASLRCSAVLSDVRILLAPSNNTRNRAKFGSSMNENQPGLAKKRSTAKKKKKMQDLERMRMERELAVQSLLEAELFRLIGGVANGEEGEDGTNSTSDDAKAENTDTSSAKPDSSSNATTTKEDGWLAHWAKGLVARILSSLQVTIQNIHIRYEDEGYGWFEDHANTPFGQQQQRHQYRPAFAVGIRLGSFSIKSENAADGDKSPSDSDSTILSRNKVANVEQLSVYWDSSHPDLFVGYSTDEDDKDYYEKRFEESDIMSSDDFEEGDGTLHHSYLIQPMSPSLKLTMVDSSGSNANEAAEEKTTADDDSIYEQPALEHSDASPSIHATLLLPCCHVGFDRNTLEDAAYIRKLISAYKVRVLSSKDSLIEQRISKQLSDLRPPLDVRPGNNPRLWWQYAIGAVRALQSNRRYFEGKSDVKGERKWRRDGWLGLARLLRLRNKYTAQYCLLWRYSHDDPESRAKIHKELLALEDHLSEVEIVALRVHVFRQLSQSSSSAMKDLDLRASESIDFDELALGKLSAASLEYRETKLRQVVQSIDFELGQSEETANHSGENVNVVYQELNGKIDDGEENNASMWAVSIECQDFTVQANDAYHAKHSLHNIPTLTERKQAVPIARLHCLYSLRFDQVGNGSWDSSCVLSSLIVTDLISPSTDDSNRGNALIGRKQASNIGGKEDAGAEHPAGHTLSIIIRNVVPNLCTQAQATTHFNVEVSPLEVTYSTVAFEALSRLFAAVKTTEFNRDYGRVTQALSRWRSRQRERLKAVLARRKKLVVSVDIAAPVLLVPEDLQNTSAPTLVIDLGRLTFRSDSRVPSGFDDKWLLGIHSVRALCIQPKLGYEHAIIEPFSLTFSILTHIAKGETAGSSKVNIEALLPQLCFNLTTSAVRLVTRLQMRWEETVKSRKFRAHKQQVTLDELLHATKYPPRRHNSRLNLFNNLEGEASPAIENASIAATKKEMKFTFAAPTISLQIGNDVGFESSPTQSSINLIPLLNLSIRGIRGDFESSRTGEGTTSHFSARLRSIHASDMQKAGSHFYHFMSSVDPGLQDNTSEMDTGMGNVDSEDEDLVAVQMSKSPQGDQETSIHFHELYVEWNPELLAAVQTSLRLPAPQVSSGSEADITNQKSNDSSEFFDAIDHTNSYKESENREVASSIQIAKDQVGTTQSLVAMPKFKVLFQLGLLRINFNKDSQNRCLFSTEMSQTDISFCRKPLGGSKTNATIAALRLKDPDGMTGGTLYGELIGLQSGGFGSPAAQKSSIVKMSFETCMTEDDDPEFHNLMQVDFSEMKFVYMHQLWLEIFDYFFEGKCLES